MATSQIRLTHKLIQDLAHRIKKGVFANVAAESLGIPFKLLQEWLNCGDRNNAQKIYRDLAQQVSQAKAKARLHAEALMLEENPRFWLLHGPGKETLREPGWTFGVRATEGLYRETGKMTEEEVFSLFGLVHEVLHPFPEARQSLINVLNEKAPMQIHSILN